VIEDPAKPVVTHASERAEDDAQEPPAKPKPTFIQTWVAIVKLGHCILGLIWLRSSGTPRIYRLSIVALDMVMIGTLISVGNHYLPDYWDFMGVEVL